MTESRSEPPKSARERLLNAAAILFYNDGIAGTGIDAIVERAGVAKKSLYNNFDSKAHLVASYLAFRHAEWLTLYDNRLRQAKDPKARVLAVFEAYEDHAEWAYERGFRGCGLLNAAAELPAADPGRQVVRGHKEQVEALLAQHLGELLADDPAKAAQLAKHLAFLLEGAIVRAGLEGRSGCVAQAKEMANAMLEAL
jgi:AcrR family transcriptional regulator